LEIKFFVNLKFVLECFYPSPLAIMAMFRLRVPFV
jgi:hypothetical protein